MPESSLRQFCKQFHACRGGRIWAKNRNLMDSPVSAVWDRSDLPPEWRIWLATRPGVLPDRDARLFACACVRTIWHLLGDDRLREAVRTAEQFALGANDVYTLTLAKLTARHAWRRTVHARAKMFPDNTSPGARQRACAVCLAAQAAFLTTARPVNAMAVFVDVEEAIDRYARSKMRRVVDSFARKVSESTATNCANALKQNPFIQ